MKRIDISREARADLAHIWNHTVDRWGRTQARAYVTGIRKTLDRIGAGDLYARTDTLLPDYLRARHGQHIIYFKESETTLRVIRILHARMDPGRHLPEPEDS